MPLGKNCVELSKARQADFCRHQSLPGKKLGEFGTAYWAKSAAAYRGLAKYELDVGRAREAMYEFSEIWGRKQVKIFGDPCHGRGVWLYFSLSNSDV